jgi:hypothetical protein
MAQTPKVVTDTRYVRGATMAFGRIKSVSAEGGSAISKRGFCLSENPNPTVDDTVSTKQLTNNGTIYYFEGLKPATKYYMRAYATNSNGETGYGEVIKFYTVPKGNVTFTLRNSGDVATQNRIKSAAEKACEYYNNMTSTSRRFNIGYGAGTQTADCNYQPEPWMNVGPNQSYQKTGTIMHEMMHGMGLMNYSTQWCQGNLRSGNGTGTWTGDRVTEALTFWENKATTLNGDNVHMWPYGINGAHEDSGTPLLYYGNAMICQALGEDGLEHNETRHADPYYSLDQEDNVKYYLKNESSERGLYTSFLKPTAAGALKWVAMSAEEAAANDSAAWYITFTPDNQYYQFRNAATGQYMTYSNGIKTLTKTKLTANDNWHLMKGRVDVNGQSSKSRQARLDGRVATDEDEVNGQRGYWVIHPESNWTPHCLQANANGNTAPATFNIANTATAQRWLILTMDAVKANEEQAVSLMKQEVEEALQQAKTLAEVPHTCTDNTTDETLQATLESIGQRLASATSTTELSALAEEARKAANDFLRAGVTPIANPFDLTYMMENPTIDENTNGWSTAATVSYGCGEFYEKTFDFSQTVKDLPAGTYAFCAQGFQRPGPYASSANVAVNATIYAGTSSEKLAHIKADAQSKKVGTGDEKTMAGKYVPNNMQAASAYFKKGYYENQVFGSVTANGNSLKIGIKSTSMPSNYWVIFDNFRLYFYGSKTAEEITGIISIQQPASPRTSTVYDLQGRKVTNLSKGIYIINGKKVMVH